MDKPRETAFGPMPLPGVTLGRINLQDIIENRRDRLLSDLLLTVFDYAINRGMGYPCTRPMDEGTAKLLEIIEQRWQAEIESESRWVEPALLADDIPGWLLRQQRQIAHAEREIAWGDAEPPAGWVPPTRGPLP